MSTFEQRAFKIHSVYAAIHQKTISLKYVCIPQDVLCCIVHIWMWIPGLTLAHITALRQQSSHVLFFNHTEPNLLELISFFKPGKRFIASKQTRNI